MHVSRKCLQWFYWKVDGSRGGGQFLLDGAGWWRWSFGKPSTSLEVAREYRDRRRRERRTRHSKQMGGSGRKEKGTTKKKEIKEIDAPR
jgi:hypothetical protein